jgi:hypothetical protein
LILSVFSRKLHIYIHGNGLSRTMKGLRNFRLSKEYPTPSKYVVKNMPVHVQYTCACFAFAKERESCTKKSRVRAPVSCAHSKHRTRRLCEIKIENKNPVIQETSPIHFLLSEVIPSWPDFFVFGMLGTSQLLHSHSISVK